MKKPLTVPALVVLTVLIGLFALPAMGLASCDYDAACEPEQGEDPYSCDDCVVPESNPIETLSDIMNWVFTFLIAFAGIMIVVAAFMFVTASGNPETVAKARHFVMYALIGVVVALMARGLLWIVQRMV